jgi:hypothetical protein
MSDFGVFIPILAICIPLVAVAGRVIVQPIVQAIVRMTEAQERLAAGRGSEDRLARMEAQLAMMEQSVARVTEAQEFQNKLLQGAPMAPPPA